jgi:hypothetical protein
MRPLIQVSSWVGTCQQQQQQKQEQQQPLNNNALTYMSIVVHSIDHVVLDAHPNCTESET